MPFLLVSLKVHQKVPFTSKCTSRHASCIFSDLEAKLLDNIKVSRSINRERSKATGDLNAGKLGSAQEDAQSQVSVTSRNKDTGCTPEPTVCTQARSCWETIVNKCKVQELFKDWEKV